MLIKKITLTEENNPNYLCYIVKIDNLRNHSNADKLKITQIFHNNIIVSKDLSIGDIGIYFPLECSINKEFLSDNNLFKNKELNKDNNICGFFEENCRVKALKLRGEKSMGFFIPCEINSSDLLNKPFNKIDLYEDVLLSKYEKEEIVLNSNKNNKNNKIPKKDTVLLNQFNFHYDTLNIGNNVSILKFNDDITISQKLHGTSVILGYLLSKRSLNWFEKILSKFKIKIEKTIYKHIYSSRKKLFNTEELYKIALEENKSSLQKGITLYGEIVGYYPDGKQIQKGYKYNCLEKEHKLFIYRITYTNIDGFTFDFNQDQLTKYCENNSLNTVPILYKGKINEFLSLKKEPKDLHNIFLEKVKEKFPHYNLEEGVPNEGVIVRIDYPFKTNALKYKTFEFLLNETNSLNEN